MNGVFEGMTFTGWMMPAHRVGLRAVLDAALFAHFVLAKAPLLMAGGAFALLVHMHGTAPAGVSGQGWGFDAFGFDVDQEFGNQYRRLLF